VLELALTVVAAVAVWRWRLPLAGEGALLAVVAWYLVQTPRIWTGRAYAIRT